MLSLTIVLSLMVISADGFHNNLHKLSQRKSSVQMFHGFDSTSFLTSVLRRVEPSQAKGEFFFFFFGGSGALGIGGAQIPSLIREAEKVKGYAGGISEGGPDLDCSPFVTIGYPEKLKLNDVTKVIERFNTLSMREILEKGPKKNYIAKMGYMEREGLFASMPDCNPLVVYATFDAFSKGGGDCANPGEAVEMMKTWQDPASGLDKWKNDVQTANLKKYSAYAVFFFLIAVVLDLVVESGINAWL